MNYKNYNDYELVSKVQENDEVCSSILFQKYQPILHKLATEFYHCFSSYGYDYDDFYQEALIGFQKAIVSFREEKNSLFYSFSILCIRRWLISFCRSISYGNKHISNHQLLEIGEIDVVDSTMDMNLIVHTKELEEMIHKVIYELPFSLGAILELKLNGFTYQEIGTLLELPTSTVEFRSRKAKKSLQSIYKKYYQN